MRSNADRRIGVRVCTWERCRRATPTPLLDRTATPDELKALVDAAHGLGLMIFLDVVYNHFGPSDIEHSVWQFGVRARQSL